MKQRKNQEKIPPEQLREIFEYAYRAMDESLIDGNCGSFCNAHCCRESDPDQESMGIYLLPFEYESVLEKAVAEGKLKLKKHHSWEYEMPSHLKFLYFAQCGGSENCLRDVRPIQCRTYPFEPHLEGDALSLVVLKDQIHQCPLLEQPQIWREEFARGVYEGWARLITIPAIRQLVLYESRNRGSEPFQQQYIP